MPPVCRFYIKGYCRYGRDCRFEHPGENPTPSSGFSFTKALQDTTIASPSSGFSFTRALESTTTPNTSPTSGGSSGHQFGQSTTFGAPSILAHHQPPASSNYYFSTPIVQRPPENLSFGGFSFVNQAAAVSALHHQQLPHQIPQQLAPATAPGYSSFSLNNTSGLFNTTSQQVPIGSSIFSPASDIDMRPPPVDETNINLNTEIQLTEAELKAYRAERFQFRQIPVRPPPDSLCA